jgi:hypothetical protein
MAAKRHPGAFACQGVESLAKAVSMLPVSAKSARQIYRVFLCSTVEKPRKAFDSLLRPGAMKAIFLCLLAFGLLQQDLAATCFVLVRVGNRLFIGSDGFRVNFGTGKVKPHCKITYVGDIVVLTWGLVRFASVLPDGRAEFHAFSDYWLPIAATPDETILQKRDRLLIEAGRLLKQQMEFAHHTGQKPTDAEAMAHWLVGAAFISMKDGIPQVGAFELRIRNWKKRQLEKVDFPGALAWDWQKPHAFGNVQALEEIVKNASPASDLRSQFQKEPAPFIERVLKLQNEFTPHEVGPPYSIAVLSDSGIEWLDSGACEAPREIVPANFLYTLGAR